MVREYEIPQHLVQQLRLALEALDTAEEARAILVDEGLLVEGRFGAKAHPAVAIERDARRDFDRLLRSLGLEEND